MPEHADQAKPSNGRGWWWFYGVLAVLLLAPSWWQWGARPLAVTEVEFDFWMGALGQGTVAVVAGRVLFSILVLGLGIAWVGLLRGWASRAGLGQVLVAAGVAAVGFSTGLPFISPDVFYYLGKGWHAVHYGADVFTVPITAAEGWREDGMFRNIHPAFIKQLGNYGPFFHAVCVGVASVSEGDPVRALVVFKLVCLAGHGLSLWAVAGLAERLGRPAGWAVAAYGLNPLVLFSLLSANHNEALMMPTVIGAVLWALRQRAWGAGLLVGLGFGIKLIPVMAVPALGAWFFLSAGRGWRGVTRSGIFAAGVLVMVLAGLALFPTSLTGIFWIFQDAPWGMFRASTYVVPLLVFNFFPWEQEAMAWTLALGKAAFVGYWGLAFVQEALAPRRPAARRLVEWVAGALVGYLVVVSPFVAEWYLIWFAPLLLVLGGRHRDFALLLLAGYLPWVIWMAHPPMLLQLFSHLAAWLFLALLAWHWAVPRLRARWWLARRWMLTLVRRVA